MIYESEKFYNRATYWKNLYVQKLAFTSAGIEIRLLLMLQKRSTQFLFLKHSEDSFPLPSIILKIEC